MHLLKTPCDCAGLCASSAMCLSVSPLVSDTCLLYAGCFAGMHIGCAQSFSARRPWWHLGMRRTLQNTTKLNMGSLTELPADALSKNWLHLLKYRWTAGITWLHDSIDLCYMCSARARLSQLRSLPCGINSPCQQHVLQTPLPAVFPGNIASSCQGVTETSLSN